MSKLEAALTTSSTVICVGIPLLKPEMFVPCAIAVGILTYINCRWRIEFVEQNKSLQEGVKDLLDCNQELLKTSYSLRKVLTFPDTVSEVTLAELFKRIERKLTMIKEKFCD